MTTTEQQRAAADDRDAPALRRTGTGLRPRQPFFSEDFEELRQRLPAGAAPDDMGGAGLSLPRSTGSNVSSPTAPRPRRWRSTCTCTGSGWPPTCAGRATPPVSGSSPGGRGRRARRRPRRGGQRPAGPAVVEHAAERVDGGWEFTGHKIFGSLSPGLDYLGMHAMDTSEPANPRSCTPSQPRRRQVPHRRDVGHAGMRATASQRHDPRPHVHSRRAGRAGLPGGFRRSRHVSRGPVRMGAARLRRCLRGDRPTGVRRDVARVHQRPSVAFSRSMAYHPGVQHHVAEMRIAMEGLTPTSTECATTGRPGSTTASSGHSRSSPASTPWSTRPGRSSTAPST